MGQKPQRILPTAKEVYLCDESPRENLNSYQVTIISDTKGVIFRGDMEALDMNKLETYFRSNNVKNFAYNKRDMACIVFLDDILTFNLPCAV